MPGVADGHAGARKAVAVLGVALCAETTSATLNEDFSKVDLKLSFRSVLGDRPLVNFNCQVKTGQSFYDKASNKDTITLALDAGTVSNLSNHGGIDLLLWVPSPPLATVFWYLPLAKNKLKTRVKLPRRQIITPALRIDLSRFFVHSRRSQRTSQQTVRLKEGKANLLRAKVSYREYKIHGCLVHPLVGVINVTRLAWRHVTRETKSRRRRELSLNVVPYLKSLFTSVPDRFLISKSEFIHSKGFIVETRYIIFWYREALLVAGQKRSVMMRIKEEIRYPILWEKYPLSESDINHKATLASWWCK